MPQVKPKLTATQRVEAVKGKPKPEPKRATPENRGQARRVAAQTSVAKKRAASNLAKNDNSRE